VREAVRGKESLGIGLDHGISAVEVALVTAEEPIVSGECR
jgi:hypothetical protein